MYNQDGVSVDEHFVRTGGKSYAINKINSVEVREKVTPGKTGWRVAWFIAVLLVVMGISMSKDGVSPVVPLIIAAFLALVGYSSFQKRHPKTAYELYLMTSSSEVQAFVTSDGDTVRDLRDAIERAMIGTAAAR